MSLKRVLFYFFICAIVGIMGGELMGAFLVRASNNSLFVEQKWIENNGYIGVPGLRLKDEIKNWQTYLKAGLLFSLSLGLAYGLFCGFFFITIGSIKLVNKYLAFSPFVILFIFYICTPGWQLIKPFGLFLIIIPIVCYFLLYKFFKFKPKINSYRKLLINLICLFIFIFLTHFLFSSYLTAQDFIRIRDKILMQNEWGKKVSRFYYDYTLYSAEAIKSFSKKLQVPINIDKNLNRDAEIETIKKKFLAQDKFLFCDAPFSYSLRKTGNKIKLISSCPDITVETDWESFISDIDTFFDEFDKKTDTTKFLRFLIKISLFFLLPVFFLIVIFLFSLLFVHYLSLIFLKNERLIGHNTLIEAFMMIAILLCFLVFIKIRFTNPSSKITLEEHIEIITGKREGNRIGSIFSILEAEQKSKEKSILKPYRKELLNMLQDEDALIRKWGIIFLKEIKYQGATKSLILSLNDHDYDVAYNAARALGALRSRQAIKPLLKKLEENNQWYFRLNAYCALKKLGWKQ